MGGESSRGDNSVVLEEKEKTEKFTFETVFCVEKSPNHVVLEDAVGNWPDLGLIALADGVGGAKKGDVMSRLAISTVDNAVQELKKNRKLKIEIDGVSEELIWPKDSTIDEVNNFVHLLFLHVVEQVKNASIKETKPGERRASTTFILALTVNSKKFGSRVFIESLGDSRAYLKRDKKAVLDPVNYRFGLGDNSYLNRWADQGEITKEEAELIDQAEDEKSFIENLGKLCGVEKKFLKTFPRSEASVKLRLKSKFLKNENEKKFLNLWYLFNIYYGKFIGEANNWHFKRNVMCDGLGADKLKIRDSEIRTAKDTDGLSGLQIEDGAEVVLVSDGISDVLTGSKIKNAWVAAPDFSSAPSQLVDEVKSTNLNLKNFREKIDDCAVVACCLKKVL